MECARLGAGMHSIFLPQILSPRDFGNWLLASDASNAALAIDCPLLTLSRRAGPTSLPLSSARPLSLTMPWARSTGNTRTRSLLP